MYYTQIEQGFPDLVAFPMVLEPLEYCAIIRTHQRRKVSNANFFNTDCLRLIQNVKLSDCNTRLLDGTIKIQQRTSRKNPRYIYRFSRFIHGWNKTETLIDEGETDCPLLPMYIVVLHEAFQHYAYLCSNNYTTACLKITGLIRTVRRHRKLIRRTKQCT